MFTLNSVLSLLLQVGLGIWYIFVVPRICFYFLSLACWHQPIELSTATISIPLICQDRAVKRVGFRYFVNGTTIDLSGSMLYGNIFCIYKIIDCVIVLNI